MKTEIRVISPAPRPSSRGGTAGPTAETNPSAGLTTSRSSTGVTRSGSRKKYVHQAVSIRPIQNSVVDVYWMLAFGVMGYFLKMYGFEVGPIILGVILGPLMDVSYRRAMIAAQDDVPAFLWEFVANPISLVLTIATLLLLASQTPLLRKRRAATQPT